MRSKKPSLPPLTVTASHPKQMAEQITAHTRQVHSELAKTLGDMVDDLRDSSINAHVSTVTIAPAGGIVDIEHGLRRIPRHVSIGPPEDDASTIAGNVRRVTVGVDASTTIRLQTVGFDADVTVKVRVW